STAGARPGVAGLYRGIHYWRGAQPGLRGPLQRGCTGPENPGQWRQPTARRTGRRPIVVERATGAAGRVLSEHTKSPDARPASDTQAASETGQAARDGQPVASGEAPSPSAADTRLTSQGGAGAA